MYEQDDSETLSGVTATYNPFTRTKQNTSMEYCIGSAIPSSMVKRCEKDWKVACKWTEKLFKTEMSTEQLISQGQSQKPSGSWGPEGDGTCPFGGPSVPIISSQRWAKASRGPSMTQFQIPTTLLDQLPWPLENPPFLMVFTSKEGIFRGELLVSGRVGILGPNSFWVDRPQPQKHPAPG